MKAAVYINEGTTQVVLTPDSEWEKAALRMIEDSANVKVFRGGFYECQGGWVRQSQGEQDSLIFRIDKRDPEISFAVTEKG